MDKCFVNSYITLHDGASTSKMSLTFPEYKCTLFQFNVSH